MGIDRIIGLNRYQDRNREDRAGSNCAARTCRGRPPKQVVILSEARNPRKWSPREVEGPPKVYARRSKFQGVLPARSESVEFPVAAHHDPAGSGVLRLRRRFASQIVISAQDDSLEGCNFTSGASKRNYTLITPTSSFTAAALLSRAAFSSGVSLISMICSIPFAPSFTGTPT